MYVHSMCVGGVGSASCVFVHPPVARRSGRTPLALSVGGLHQIWDARPGVLTGCDSGLPDLQGDTGQNREHRGTQLTVAPLVHD